jgi:hypothetical protein
MSCTSCRCVSCKTSVYGIVPWNASASGTCFEFLRVNAELGTCQRTYQDKMFLVWRRNYFQCLRYSNLIYYYYYYYYYPSSSVLTNYHIFRFIRRIFSEKVPPPQNTLCLNFGIVTKVGYRSSIIRCVLALAASYELGNTVPTHFEPLINYWLRNSESKKKKKIGEIAWIGEYPIARQGNRRQKKHGNVLMLRAWIGSTIKVCCDINRRVNMIGHITLLNETRYTEWHKSHLTLIF